MNVNPDATVVLCYGDSNTFGQRADIKGKRWPADVRWTGQLQQQLGDDYYVIEEGLPSRTTDLDYDKKPGRNGKEYLAPCIGSHNPIDVVVLMLGTNDLKITFARSAEQIADALEGLASDVFQYARNKEGGKPKVVLVSPIHIDEQASAFVSSPTPHYDHTSAVKAKQLAAAIQTIAERQGCTFVDAAEVAKPGEDGIHFAKESHHLFSQRLLAVIAD